MNNREKAFYYAKKNQFRDSFEDDYKKGLKLETQRAREKVMGNFEREDPITKAFKKEQAKQKAIQRMSERNRFRGFN